MSRRTDGERKVKVSVKTCQRHRGIDTDGDGECSQFATATPQMQEIMGRCAFSYKNPVEEEGILDPDVIHGIVTEGHKDSYRYATDLADYIAGPMRVIGRRGIGPTEDVVDVALYLDHQMGDCVIESGACRIHDGMAAVDVWFCAVGRFKTWVLDMWDEDPSESEGY